MALMDNASHVINERCLQQQRAQRTDCPYMLGDFSARTINHHYFWPSEPRNRGLPTPREINVDRIHHVYNDTKILVIVRNPAERLFSDYKFYAGSHNNVVTADDFHERVVTAVEVWNNCTQVLRLPENRCAYGTNFPPELPKRGFWSLYSADRLRIGIYSIYVINCFKVFPRSNIHVIKLEEFSKNSLTYTETHLLPFLGLEPYDASARAHLRRDLARGRVNTNTNHQHEHVKMHARTRRLLDDFYRPYNKQLSELLNDTKFMWND